MMNILIFLKGWEKYCRMTFYSVLKRTNIFQTFINFLKNMSIISSLYDKNYKNKSARKDLKIL